jgi:hypothetical protein
MGAAFDPAFAFTTWFGPGRHDGASSAALVAYDDACGCFQYVTEPRPIG